MPVPLYIMEEHHEALIVWRDAICRGILPAKGNSLLHVDEHSDMALPSVQTPIRQAFDSDEEIRRFVFEELNIGNFNCQRGNGALAIASILPDLL